MDSGALLDLLGNENRRRILRLLAHRPCYVTEISEYIGVSPKAVIDHLRRLEEAGLVESHVDDQRRKYFHISRNLRLEVNVSPYTFRMKSAYPASANLELKAFHHVSIETGGATTTTTTASAGTDAAEVGDASDGGDAIDAGDATDGAGTADGSTGTVDGDEAAATADLDGSETATVDPDADDGVTALATELGRLQELERELSVAQRWVQGRVAELQGELSDAVADDGNERLYAEVLAAVAGGATSPERVGDRVEVPGDVAESALSALADRGYVERAADGWRLAT